MKTYRLNADHSVSETTDGDYSAYNDFGHHVDDTMVGSVRVSTVFLVIDHGTPWKSDSLPVLFETMIFGGPLDSYQERYCTWEEAVAGHAKAVQQVKETP